jgi:hypothetical protein
MAAMTARSSPSPPPEPSKLNNTSFVLTRLTPLYNLNASRLPHYAREFRDIVRGDVIRGVRTSAATSDRAKSALIRSCEWTIENDLIPTEPFDSLVVKLTWDDSSSFIAILIPNFTSSETVTLGKRKRGSSTDGAEFTPLPLLLTRGPQLVTQQFVTYLTTRFDSRASELNIPAPVLEDCLQGYLEIAFQEDPPPRVIERRVKLLELQFATPQPQDTKVKGALKKITLSFVAPDVQELYRRYEHRFELTDLDLRL